MIKSQLAILTYMYSYFKIFVMYMLPDNYETDLKYWEYSKDTS